MAKIGDYKIENFYQGGYSSLDPSQNFSPISYTTQVRDIGIATDPRVANIVKDASHKLSSGARTIEISQVSPEVFDSIPDEQLIETKRLAKLLDVDITMHAPVIEPSGMTQQGFSESNRIAVENQMKQAMRRASLLNPNGSIPVTFHSSASVPDFIVPKEKKPEETYIVDIETGAPSKIPIKTRAFPGEKEIDINKEIKRHNEDHWNNQLTSLSYAASMGENHWENGIKEKIAGQETSLNLHVGINYINDSYRQLKRLYDTAYNAISKDKNSNPNDKRVLDSFYKRVEKEAEIIKNNPKDPRNVERMQKIVKAGLTAFDKLSTPPEMIKKIDDFAREKTTETFANVALDTYNEFTKKGKKSPIICIENPPAGTTAFNTGEELRKVIEISREKLVNKLTEEGVSKSEAKKQAAQLIGATWDVGHINMLRKYGYSEKDIIKETKKIAPVTKHVHLSDNFGMEHTELPMGMGNVPMKEIMEKLGEKGFEAKKIIEAGNWWQHFSDQGKISPFQSTLEAFGSSIYSEGVGPYWNQVGDSQQGYFSGFGTMLPQGNYSMWGSGFSMSSLPIELGGQMPGGQGSRMSGRPME
jgi:hypothetical protein